MDFVADLIHEIQVHSGAILVLILTQCIDGVICHEFKGFFLKTRICIQIQKIGCPSNIRNETNRKQLPGNGR